MGAAAGAISAYSELSKEDEVTIGDVAAKVAGPIATASVMLAPRARRTAINLSKTFGGLEQRGKVAWGITRTLDDLLGKHPTWAATSNDFNALIHEMNAAEGQRLPIDALANDARRMEDAVQSFPPEWNAAINSYLEGVAIKDLPEIPGMDKRQLAETIDWIENRLKQQSYELNQQVRRTGASVDEESINTQGYHKQNQSTAVIDLKAYLTNIRQVLGKNAGLTVSNIPNIAKAVDGYLRGNSQWTPEGIKWVKGRERGWWRSSNGLERRGLKRADGSVINPDDMRSKDEYDQWVAHEPTRLANTLVDMRSKLDANTIGDSDFESMKRILPYLGDVVHNIHALDIIKDIEHRQRNIMAYRKLGDGFFDRIKNLYAKVEAFASDAGNAEAGMKDGADKVKEVKMLLDDLKVMIGGTTLGNNHGTLFGDANELVGNGPGLGAENMANRFIGRMDNAFSGPILGNALKYNPLVGVRQEGQALAARAASRLSSVPNYLRERVASMPVFGGKDVDGGRKLYQNPITNFLVNSTKVLERSTEQIQAATINGFMRDVKPWFMTPKKEFQQYIDRMFDAETQSAIRNAIASGDDISLKEFLRPMIVRELDMVNGSGLSTSRPTMLKGSSFAKAAGKMVGTPLSITTNVLSGRGQYGPSAVSGGSGIGAGLARGASQAASFAGLGASQLASNAAITAFPVAKAAALAAIGSPLLAAYYFMGIGEPASQQEATAQAKLSTVAEMAKDAAGGDPEAAMRTAGAVALESLPTKLGNSSDIISDYRGSLAKTLGLSAGGTVAKSGADMLATILPTVAGPAVMLGQTVSDIGRYGAYGALTKQSQIPLVRTIFERESDPTNVSIIRKKIEAEGEGVNPHKMTEKQRLLRVNVPR